jgi:uncharacterized membrane protein
MTRRAFLLTALCLAGTATTSEAHGEQLLFILGADLAVLLVALIVAVLWRVPWKGRLVFVVACVAGLVATNTLPWFPNTVGASAPYDDMELILIFGVPPIALGSVVYLATARWHKAR